LLYDPDDTDEPAPTIEQLLLDPERAAKLGETGRKAVLEKFDITQTARQTVRIYEEIIKQFPRG
jgi:glycosyltransferase involved in cell wall biosynthesis